ncbi:MAG: hypothetical protein NT076_04380 [Candidatus Pacearchaeota archaeon]|nr:hypothetical protein [Candidatus Pacearchaeota archaeon]
MKSSLAIEHLARFEQRRMLKRGKFVNLFCTSTVQNLPNEEKNSFFSYLKRKKRAPKLLAGIFVLCLIGAFIFAGKLTGLIVIENQPNSSFVSLLFILIAVILVIAALAAARRTSQLESRFKEDIEIAERKLH